MDKVLTRGVERGRAGVGLQHQALAHCTVKRAADPRASHPRSFRGGRL